MRTQLQWSDTVPVEDSADGSAALSGVTEVARDISFRPPDGQMFVAAVSQQLIVYSTIDAKILRLRNRKSTQWHQLLSLCTICNLTFLYPLLFPLCLSVANKADIYSVSCSRDGNFFASGGAGKAVSVWTFDLSQKYTYNHSESVQVVAFNPVSANLLLSCSNIDFALWLMPATKMNPKIKVASKILSAAWTSDGQYFALGLINGLISIRDAAGIEKIHVNRSAPIWDLCWLQSKSESQPYDTLAVACWDQTLSLYQLTGQQIGRDKSLGCDPCSVRSFSGGDYLAVAGSDKKVTFFTRDGIKLGSSSEGKNWIWRAQPKIGASGEKGAPLFAVATDGGEVAVHSLVFSTVHGLYQDRYAFRDSMTDVVVQNLITDQRVRIKCRDYVKKLAIYKGRLAVQLPDRVIIYEVAESDEGGVDAKNGSDASSGGVAQAIASNADSSSPTISSAQSMMYRVKDRINAAIDCNLLVVTSSHLILCLDRKLQLMSFSGVKEREWVLESPIRYVKVIGGLAGREGVLTGLKNGQVIQIFADKPFPVNLVKHKLGIRCLDMSLSRRKVAIVDESSGCYVYDILTGGELLFSESPASSVAWNSQMEDMLCFSGGGMLSMKTGGFPLHQQKMAGFVVGYTGSKIFCLQSGSMVTVDVPQSASLYRYVEEKDWVMAYRTACLGVTESDWRFLGESALKALNLNVGRAAFVRLRDMRYLELISHIESSQRARKVANQQSQGGGGLRGNKGNGAIPLPLTSEQTAPPGGDEEETSEYLAEIMAYTGKYQDAAKLHVRAGTIEKAIEMFTDMRLWSEAKKFAEESGRVDVSALLLKQAAWCEDSGDIMAAATIYSGLGMAVKAVQLLGERQMFSQLINLVRTLPSADSAGTGESATKSSTLTSGVATKEDGGSGGGGGSTSLTQDTKSALRSAGNYFKRAELMSYAREAFLKLGDVRSLLQLHIDLLEWSEAFLLVSQSTHIDTGVKKTLQAHVHLSRAEWLATEDRFEEAQRDYEAGGRPDLSVLILEQLASSAIEEDRFSEAGKNYFRLARDAFFALSKASERPSAGSLGSAALLALKSAAATATNAEKMNQKLTPLLCRFRRFVHSADVYRAYSVVHESLAAPFLSMFSIDAAVQASRFEAARFVLNSCLGPTALTKIGSSLSSRGEKTNPQGKRRIPYGISVAVSLFVLARQSVLLRAWKTAREALSALNELVVPKKFFEEVEQLTMTTIGKPMADPEELVPTCYRCGSSSSALLASKSAITQPPSNRPKIAKYKLESPNSSTPSTLTSPSSSYPPGGYDNSSDVNASYTSEFFSGDICSSCGHSVVRSALSFEPLPLVEFEPSPEIGGFDAALRLIGSYSAPAGEPSTSAATTATQQQQQQAQVTKSGAPNNKVQTLSMEADVLSKPVVQQKRKSGDDLFKELLAASADHSTSSVEDERRASVLVPGSILEHMEPRSVFVQRAKPGGSGILTAAEDRPEFLRPRFFYSLFSEIGISMTSCCGRFFHTDELEIELLRAGGRCPCCGGSADGE